MHELGEADEHKDPSLWHVPSVCSPRQFFRFNAWRTLVDLVRDAWLAVLKDDPPRARQTALSGSVSNFVFKAVLIRPGLLRQGEKNRLTAPSPG